MRPFRIFLLALALAGAAFGQTARLTRDIAAGPGTNEGSDPDQLTLLGSRVFFRASEPTTGEEVWTSDGTPGGTTLLREACPGPCSDAPEILGTLNGAVLWITFRSGYLPPVLWRSDGTRAGTFQLVEGVGSTADTMRDNLVFFRGALYFDRCDNLLIPSRCELWRTDGTAAGTGPAFAQAFGAGLTLYPAGDRLFFFSHEYPRPDLWVWDGTGDPSRVREDVDLTSKRIVAAAGGRLFFVAGNGDQEVWVSDGTAAGTRAVSGFQPANPIQSGLAALGTRVWFVVNDALHGDEIWIADGTVEGTRRVTDFPNQHPFEGVRPQVMEVGGRLVFPATDGIAGVKLWTTTGDPASTSPVRDAVLVADSPLVQAGGRVFGAADGAVFSTDGTAKGTRVVDVCPACDDQARLLQAAGNGVLYLARSPATGPEIWITDGTPGGTRPLTSLPGAARPVPVPVARGNVLYFQAADGHGEELWRTDANGTRQVTDIARGAAGPVPRDLAAVGSDLFFSACAADRREVWRGSPGSGVRLADLQDTRTCSPFSAAYYGFAAVGNLLFYSRGSELWRSDGTESGTFQVLGPGSMYPPIVEVGGKALFIRTQDGTHDLWTSDGTPGGTALAVDLPDLVIHNLEKVGPEVYFFATRLDSEVEVWRTDGTPSGTRRIAADVEYPRFIGFFVRSGPWVYFLADGDDGSEIWRTDGTAAGTSQVVASPDAGVQAAVGVSGGLVYYSDRSLWIITHDGRLTKLAEFDDDLFNPGGQLAAHAGRAWLTADDGVHGQELWVSDGTAGGTRLVRDIIPGPADSRAFEPVSAGERLFFSATDGVHGEELWQSDGTEAGTRMVQDLRPGGAGSRPNWLVAAEGYLYFLADDGLTGREVWTLPLAGPKCQAGDDRLCLGGRFQVEAAWRDFQGGTGIGHGAPLTPDTGTFWFFNPANVEVALKVLDGLGVNGHRWVFYGALSNVEYNLTVTDTETGLARRWFNPAGQFASVGDTTAFGPLGESEAATVSEPAPAARISRHVEPASATASCAPSSTRLCLNGDRFAVEVSWKDFQGRTGVGQAAEITGDTGTFWFFSPANVELVLKVLDGTPLNGHHWVFYGALSNVQYTITVTDTATGEVAVYENAAGHFASVGDTGAF